MTNFVEYTPATHDFIEFECYVRELEGKPEQENYILKLEVFDDSIIKVI